MEHLWAPWRNSYVGKTGTDKTSSENLFFEIGQSSADRENLVLHRSKSSFALLNRFPYNTGHMLILPYRKVAEPGELSESEWADLWATAHRMMDLLKQAYQPHGFNVGINIGAAAGAGIPQHIHIHVVPRWNGDANFMTSTAQTRVHPSDLEAVYTELRGRLGP